VKALVHAARAAGPYLLIELLLPGGTVIAVLLWLYQNRFRSNAGKTKPGLSIWPAFVRLMDVAPLPDTDKEHAPWTS
jgi:hypothetical protein